MAESSTLAPPVEKNKKWLGRFPLLALLVLGVLTNSALIGFVLYKGRKDRKAIYKKLEEFDKKSTPSDGPGGPRREVSLLELPLEIPLTHDEVERFNLKRLRTALDIGPAEWTEAPYQFRKPESPLSFTPDDIPNPTPDAISRWTKEAPVLRLMPYPYFRALAVPWDPENSSDIDIYYSQMLLSRKYGLDFPSAFFPYVSMHHPSNFAFMSGDSEEPRLHAVRIAEARPDDIDALPFFLTSYYRGWTDHIHGWTAESVYPHSVIQPCQRRLKEDGEANYPLHVKTNIHPHRWRGLEIQLDIADGITSFEIELVEANKLSHFIVYGTPLRERSGWDISKLDRDQLKTIYLLLGEEVNRSWTTNLGQGASANLLRASVKVVGKKGNTIRLESIKIVDPDRESIRKQMAQMKKLNILPAVATSHGGYSGWALMKFQGVDNYPLTFAGETSIRRALGSTPGTPAYMSDLLQDFGTIFLNRIDSTPRRADSYVCVDQLPDGRSFYDTNRCFLKTSHAKVPTVSKNPELTEQTGAHLCRFLARESPFGQVDCLYMHNNIFSGHLVEPRKAEAPYVYMRDVKSFDPTTAATFEMLANCQYNLDDARKFHQRIWCCPVSVASRYALGLRNLAGNVQIKGNDVHIRRKKDRVTGRMFPDLAFLTQDLHGQTFYVIDANKAAVFCEGRSLTSLQRNLPDFSGRPSVTVVDTSTPTRIFDEVDFFEQNGHVKNKDALLFFQEKQAFRGRYALQVQSIGAASGMIAWKPVALDSHETEYFRFAYKKTNPNSKLLIGWSDGDKLRYVATDGDLNGIQGWKLPEYRDTEWHDVVLAFADMQAGREKKAIPRGAVKTVFVGILGGAKDDSIYYDCVEFLSARGVRPSAGEGLVIGGRLTPHRDGKIVRMKGQSGQVRKAVTTRGGWYFFENVPKDSIVEITTDEAGITFYPARGRVHQACKNDVELHLFTEDPRSNSLPRPAIKQLADRQHYFNCEASSPDFRAQYNGLYSPHATLKFGGPPGFKMEFLVEDQVNNFGHYDKDRRFDNPDQAFRIQLLGDCLLENVQSVRNHHLNVYLESFLRRDTGVNVEVIVAASPNASPSSNAPSFEKYGKHFKPDVVVHMVMPWTLVQMEPTLQEMRWGWVRDHTPYQMYDFDEKGKLIGIPRDPDYAIHTKSPISFPMLGDVPLEHSFFALTESPDLTKRSFRLFKAVLAERYMKEIKTQRGAMYVVTGYQNWHYPKYQRTPKAIGLARERWLEMLKTECGEIGVPVLDLAASLRQENDSHDYWIWVNDGHHTPTGNYQVARAIADQLLANQEFRARLEKAKKRLKSGDSQ